MIDCETGLTDQGSQRALRERAMFRNYETSVRRIAVPKNNVASALTVALVAQLLECPDCLAGGDARQLAQTATSTSSSLIAGGIGSPRSLRLST